MGKLMINGEQYPAIVVKAGLDDTQTRKDATWSSDKINEELEDVRNELDIIVEEANKNTTINDSGTTSTTSTWSSSKIATEIDNAILTKDIIYKGALTANTRTVISTSVGIDLSKIVSISKIFGDTFDGWDYGICQMTSVGELIYMPTATSESSYIQIRIAYRG